MNNEQLTNEVSSKKPSGLFKFIGTIIVILIAVFTFWKIKDNNSNSETTTSTDTGQGNSGNIPTPTTSTNYKNGTYSATGLYDSPAGEEEVGLTLTLKDGTIISSTFTPRATNPISKKMQDNFNAGYTTLVIGKSIAEVKLDVVNGSSLTPKGFNDAVEKIKAQATVTS